MHATGIEDTGTSAKFSVRWTLKSKELQWLLVCRQENADGGTAGRSNNDEHKYGQRLGEESSFTWLLLYHCSDQSDETSCFFVTGHPAPL